MKHQELLLHRLEAIGASLQTSGHALALIGLGSVGQELSRLDEYSDLDFFAIVEDGFKQDYLKDLGWLESIAPVAFCFKNTRDGFKLLYTDDIFCEFAVFEMQELAQIPFAAGRMVWRKPEVPESIATPLLEPQISPSPDPDFALGEALTNLYIGLKRFRRGEKMSALRFVQQYALHHVLTLAENLETEQSVLRDMFSAERRIEQRLPKLGQFLPSFAQGYERSPESALAILGFLEANFEVNKAIAAAIRALA